MVSTTISFLVTFPFSNSIGSEYLKEFRSSKEISDLSHQVLRQNIDVATPPHSCCAITSCKPVMYGKLQINYNSITSFIDAPTESFTALARCLVASHQTRKLTCERQMPRRIFCFVLLSFVLINHYLSQPDSQRILWSSLPDIPQQNVFSLRVPFGGLARGDNGLRVTRSEKKCSY